MNAGGVRKGEDWGRSAPLPAGSPIAATDRELRSIVSAAWSASVPPPVVGLIGGDLAATLGSPGRTERLSSDEAQELQIDVGFVTLDNGTEHVFVSHLIARRSWWRGRLFVVANAAWRGPWNIAPRAHPGDGRFDLLDTEISAGERMRGRRRLNHGGHLPHPEITTRRIKETEQEFKKALDVFVDDEKVGRTMGLQVRIEPGFLTVVV